MLLFFQTQEEIESEEEIISTFHYYYSRRSYRNHNDGVANDGFGCVRHLSSPLTDDQMSHSRRREYNDFKNCDTRHNSNNDTSDVLQHRLKISPLLALYFVVVIVILTIVAVVTYNYSWIFPTSVTLIISSISEMLWIFVEHCLQILLAFLVPDDPT